MLKINKQRKKVNQFDIEQDGEIFGRIDFSGVIPSPVDTRDFSAACLVNESFPNEYEPSKKVPILDQGSVSSCVAFSCAAALMHGEENALSKYNDYSRGYIYGNRTEEDYQEEGMYIRQALKQLNHCGDVLYDAFPYNARYHTVKELIESNKEELARLALDHKIIEYFRCYTEADIKRTILQNGCVIISVPVYSDFGRNLHKTETDDYSGNHAMIIVGWTADGKWIVQNSWGKLWGYGGRLLMDNDYPVNEYWGIVVTEDNVFGDNKSIWKKIWLFIKGIFLSTFKK